MLGEFDRVANQVQNDLPQSRGVSIHHARAFAIDVTQQLEALSLRRLGVEDQCTLDLALQVEIDRFELQPPRFHLGEVEHVVEHGQQAR